MLQLWPVVIMALCVSRTPRRRRKVMIIDYIFPGLLVSSHRESENTRCYRVVAKIQEPGKL